MAFSKARGFPTFSNTATDESAGTLDAKEFAQAQADKLNWLANNTPVTLAHTGTGTANALACTSDPAISAYAADQSFWLTPSADNTGAATIVIDGQASRAIVGKAGDALTGGELVTGSTYLIKDNGTHLRIMNPDAVNNGGGGGFTDIQGTSLSGQSSVDITGMADYTTIRMYLQQISPSDANTEVQLLCSDDNGSTFEATGYWFNETSGTEAVLNVATQFDASDILDIYIEIKKLAGNEVIISAAYGVNVRLTLFDNGNEVTAFRIQTAVGTFDAGTLHVEAQ